MVQVAAIDVGSNATRLVLLSVSSSGRERQYTYKRYPLQLGQDVFRHGKLTRSTLQAMRQTFVEIADRLGQASVVDVRAVGTAAMREAANGQAAVRSIARHTGIQIDVISGAQESLLARSALLKPVGSIPKQTLLLDLGGGSLELSRAHRQVAKSLPIGTARLVESHPELLEGMPISAVDSLVDALRRKITRHTRMHGALLVGTGGNLDALTRILPAPLHFTPGIDVRQLKKLSHQIARLRPDDRATHYGIRDDRAALLLASVVILRALTTACDVSTFVAPGTGLREALLQERLTALGRGEAIASAADALGQEGTRRLATLCKSLFEGLRAVHGLWEPGLEPLLAACRLYQVGQAISTNNAAAHTGYMLKHTEALGLDKAGRAIAQTLATDALTLSPVGPHRRKARGNASALSGKALDITRGAISESTAIERLRAILRLGRLLEEAGAKRIAAVHILESPVRVDAGLKRPLPGTTLAAIGKILGCKIQVC